MEYQPSGHDTSQALLRLMFGVEGFAMNMEHAVLRAMDSTPELCSEMPLWGSAATRKTWQEVLAPGPQLRILFAGQRQLGHRSARHRPKEFLVAAADAECELPKSKSLGSRPLADVLKSSCGEISGSGEDVDLISLRAFLQKLRGAHADPNFRFTSLPPGQRTLERLLEELETSLHRAVQQQLLRTSLPKLIEALRQRAQMDLDTASGLIEAVVRLANAGSAGDALRRRCGTLTTLSFSGLVAALMAQASISEILETVARAMALLVRVGQASRAAEKAVDLQQAMAVKEGR
eukprot:Skav202688  [mRNA]  locus=scaffold3222:15818:27814:+ [translate_table: standard]